MPAPRTLALRTTGITYPGAPEHVRAVRADLRGLLDGCPMADDVILCASELAANAALHSNSRLPDGQFTVRAEIHPGEYVWIEVEDGGGPWIEPVPTPARATGSTSSASSPATAASTATTSPASSGPASTGPRHEQPQAPAPSSRGPAPSRRT
jgi:hypothetical protein